MGARSRSSTTGHRPRSPTCSPPPAGFLRSSLIFLTAIMASACAPERRVEPGGDDHTTRTLNETGADQGPSQSGGPIAEPSYVSIVLRITGTDGTRRVYQHRVSPEALVESAMRSRSTALSRPTLAPPLRFELATNRAESFSTFLTGVIDTTETIEGSSFRILASPYGLTDFAALQVDDSTVATFAMGYTIEGAVAVPTSMAAIFQDAAAGMSLEVSLGAEAIAALGGEPLEDYTFLETRQSEECLGALLPAGAAVANFFIVSNEIRNPLKWLGIFQRLRVAKLAAAGSMLLAHAACSGDET